MANIDNGKYQSVGRALTPREAELIILLIEEAGEIVQAGAKLLRFGKDDVNPETGVLNTVELATEVGQFFCVRGMLEAEGILDQDVMLIAMREKRERLAYFLQT